MQNKQTLTIFVILFLCNCFPVAGQQDTVYIYEDVVVYDTVYVYDTIFAKPSPVEILPINLKIIGVPELDTVNLYVNLMLILNMRAASFLENSIIPAEDDNASTKNPGSIKKTIVEISAGTGAWWENGKMNYIDKPPPATLLNIGVFIKKKLGNTKLQVKTGLEYSRLMGSQSYQFDGSYGVQPYYSYSEFDNINSNYVRGLDNVSIPVLFYFNKYKIQPCFGLNYNIIFVPSYLPATNDHIGLNFGMAFRLNELFAINVEYKHNLTRDYAESIPFIHGVGPTILYEPIQLKNNQVKFSLAYSFKKKKIV